MSGPARPRGSRWLVDRARPDVRTLVRLLRRAPRLVAVRVVRCDPRDAYRPGDLLVVACEPRADAIDPERILGRVVCAPARGRGA